MGFISNWAEGKADEHRAEWRRVFGSVSKEEPPKPDNAKWNRSLVGSTASVARLLEALRSLAPGSWTDDRWEQSKAFEGIAYVAINRICEQMSQSEFTVYERDDHHPDGKRPVHKDHPLIKLLQKPNPDDSFGDLLYAVNQQLDLTGSALMWMVPNVLGVPCELYPIPTAIAIPQAVMNPEYPHGYYRIQPLYPYGPFSSHAVPYSAVGAPIPAQWMMTIRNRHPLYRFDGYSPMTALRLHFDEVKAIDRSRWYSQHRGLSPSAVLNFDGQEGAEPLPEMEIQRIRAEFENDHQGPENTGRLFVATPGAKLEPWGGSPKDMEYQAGWEQLVSFCLAGLGITKPAAGMIEDSSYSTLFATLKQFHLLTLEPKLNKIAGKLTRHLAPFFGDNLVVEIKCQRIDDHDVKFQKLTALVNARAIKKNELRREMDMDLTREAWGDEFAGEQSQLTQQQNVLQPPGGMQAPDPRHVHPLGAGRVYVHSPGNGDGQGDKPDERDMERGRPSPGTLAQGALGPRKSFAPAIDERERILERAVKMQAAKPITVNVAPPVVNISNVIPEQKIPQVNVHVPEQKIPQVNVHVPEQKIPQVNVHVPRQSAPVVKNVINPVSPIIKNILPQLKVENKIENKNDKPPRMCRATKTINRDPSGDRSVVEEKYEYDE